MTVNSCTHTHSHTRTYAGAGMQLTHTHTCVQVRTHTHAHTHVHTHMHVHTHTHINTHAYVRTHARTHVHTYLCTEYCDMLLMMACPGFSSRYTAQCPYPEGVVTEFINVDELFAPSSYVDPFGTVHSPAEIIPPHGLGWVSTHTLITNNPDEV